MTVHERFDFRFSAEDRATGATVLREADHRTRRLVEVLVRRVDTGCVRPNTCACIIAVKDSANVRNLLKLMYPKDELTTETRHLVYAMRVEENLPVEHLQFRKLAVIIRDRSIQNSFC